MEGVLAGMDMQGLIPPGLFAMNNLSGSTLPTSISTGIANGGNMRPAQQMLLNRSSRKFVLDGSKELGSGSTGTVFRAKYNCLPCVVKVLHPKYQSGAMRDSVYRECTSLLCTLRHPNIVQFIDIHEYLPPSPAPGTQPFLALVMEAMEQNLTTYLKNCSRRSHSSIPWHMLVNISHDVSLALHYLHCRGLTYLILSSNNVLLQNGGRGAKISDHGVTRLPETRAETVYTAPEARMNKPSLHSDVFSFGVLLMQMVTLKYPEPKFMLAHDASSGSLTMATELSRRKSDFSLVPRKHVLRQTILHCIADSEQARPMTEELCTDFEVMKKKKEYLQSIRKKRKHKPRSSSSSSADSESSDESTSSEEDSNTTSSDETSSD